MTFFATQSDQQQIKPIVGKCGVISFPTQSLLKHLFHQCQFQIQFCFHLHRASHRQSHSHHHISHLAQYISIQMLCKTYDATTVFVNVEVFCSIFVITIRHRDFNMTNAPSTTHRRALNCNPQLL